MDKVFRIEDTIRRIRDMSSDGDTTLVTNMEASDNLIEWFETTMGMKLPDDFKKFYYFSDGIEGGKDMFRIIPLDEIVDNSRDKEINWKRGEFDFAEFLMYCDTWTVSVDQKNHNNYIIYGGPDNGRINYTDSLAEFLERYLDGGVYDGIYEWEDEIKRNKRS